MYIRPCQRQAQPAVESTKCSRSFQNFLHVVPCKRMPVVRRRRPRKIVRRRFPMRRQRTVRVPKYQPFGPVGDSKRVKLKYVQTFNRSLASGISSNLIRGNSPHDPEWSAGGGQPYGYDQWAVFYKKYLCTSSKIRVRFSETSSGTVPMVVVVQPRVTSTVDTDVDLLQQRPYSRVKFASPSGSNVHSITSYQSAKRMFGLKGLRAEDNTYTALTTANPAQEWYWHVVAFPQDEISNVAGNFTIEITYYVTFFLREPLSAS